MGKTSALVSATDLAALLGQPNVKVVDATYGQPPAAQGIGNAVNFDIDRIAAPAAPLPHTIPTAEDFAAAVGALGIGNDDLVVVYDQTGMSFAAARVWWMFRLFGHDNVKILDGGLPAWMAAGLPLSPKAPPAAGKTFAARFRPELFKTRDEMLANIAAGNFAVLDARDPRRFSGQMAEPRPGMQAGHIPGSKNLFFGSLISPDNGHLLPPDQLRAALAESGADIGGKAVACTCGSGVTACVVALALHEIGRDDAAIYGGSWSEWATTPGLPVEKDEA